MGCFLPKGAGLGIRREHLPDLMVAIPDALGFFELAPENWMDMGGVRRKQLQHLASQRPLVAHGLSLNLGGTDPLDEAFLRRVKAFLDTYQIGLFTEHLSWCAQGGHLYDLLPIPFTHEAVEHVAGRIARTQEILERRIAIENASYYVSATINEMDEACFTRAVLMAADCDLHLDVNNVYVNSCNFGFDPSAFIAAMPPERIVYLHMAGHLVESDGLLIDTHGSDVIDPVWRLLEETYGRVGVRPTLLERDFNIPPLHELMHEVAQIDALQQRYGRVSHVA